MRVDLLGKLLEMLTGLVFQTRPIPSRDYAQIFPPLPPATFYFRSRPIPSRGKIWRIPPFPPVSFYLRSHPIPSRGKGKKNPSHHPAAIPPTKISISNFHQRFSPNIRLK